MKLKLTKEQLVLIKNRIQENLIKEKVLRKKVEEGERVAGWDFIDLNNENLDLEKLIEEEYITI